VNDTYLAAWNSIPPTKPTYFPAFIGRITRNLALKKYEYLSAEKRNPEAACSLNELIDCVSGRESIESDLENRRIEDAISSFLWQQEKEMRDIFILRYWYFESIQSICRHTKYSQTAVNARREQNHAPASFSGSFINMV
jgi:DNA-directed RNA polymerase specialized sigma24 family protein